jgi:hypothetical protein
VSPGLLATMGNRLIAGREFTWTDTYERRPVAMLSENLARELWQDPRPAIGKQITDARSFYCPKQARADVQHAVWSLHASLPLANVRHAR